MDETSSSLIVFFENPFWVGVFEQISDGKLSVCKVTFGAEPKDYEVNNFIQKNFYKLKFSPQVQVTQKVKSKNPKRIQREVHKQMKNVGVGTKSQQALSLQHEQMKTQRKEFTSKQKEEEKLRKFELKQQKRKEKHKGR